MLHSIEIEKHALAGLIQNRDVIAEVDSFFSSKDFVIEQHRVIYSCLRSNYTNDNSKVDITLLAQKISQLGITFKEDISIFDYLNSITFSQVTYKSTIESCKELCKLTALREINQTADNIKKLVTNSPEKKLDEIISEADAIYGNKINSLVTDDGPVDIFDNLKETIDNISEKPQDIIGLSTPFENFNRLYGGLRGGNVYAIASRTGEGKTSLLSFLGYEMSKIHKRMPVLILDSEMQTNEIQLRIAASLSGVSLWEIESGNWKKNKISSEKIKNSFKNIKEEYNVFHYHVGNKHIDQILSIIRRWYLKHVGRGNNCLVIYDYLKITTEKVTQNWAEHQLIGEKTSKLKEISVEINNPIFTAIQINRMGINTGRDSYDVVDDASVISQSDRVSWFVSFLAIFRRKTQDEIQMDTPGLGTHKLIEIKGRYQGQQSEGHQNEILRMFPDGKQRFVRNYISFEVFNFNVSERGTLQDAIEAQNGSFLVTDGQNNEEDTL